MRRHGQQAERRRALVLSVLPQPRKPKARAVFGDDVDHRLDAHFARIMAFAAARGYPV